MVDMTFWANFIVDIHFVRSFNFLIFFYNAAKTFDIFVTKRFMVYLAISVALLGLCLRVCGLKLSVNGRKVN